MHTSGFMKLPSERTLRDYTNYFKYKTRFQPEEDAVLRSEVDNEEWKNYVVLFLDEMNVKENLVYDKCACKVINCVCMITLTTR